MKYHKVLARQLARLDLNEGAVPDKTKWMKFLERLNNLYIDAENDRYLLERSMDLSSKELIDSNKKLEEAQHLAGIGYWFHDLDTNENSWSKEVYRMLGCDLNMSVPGINEFHNYIFKDDFQPYMTLVERALQKGESYEINIRCKVMHNKKEEYRWFKVIGKPIASKDKSIHKFRGIIMDIHNAKKAERELKHLHEQLIVTARRAGMTEVATSILHNIGNVLNSVNVSIAILNENLNTTELKKLQAISTMIVENDSKLADFFTKDEKGKIIPGYLVELIKQINLKYGLLNQELADLNKQIEHIKDITKMQKQLSGISGMIEKVPVSEIIETSIKMCSTSDIQQKVTLIKKFEKRLCVETDKSKLTQIIVNLIQNATDALMEMNRQNKTIVLQLKSDATSMELSCEDNGSGINEEDLKKIFSFGFTTKKQGHGFGLHSSAIAAQELGGKLEVINKGKHEGVIFKLTLPLKYTERRHHEEEKIYENISD